MTSRARVQAPVPGSCQGRARVKKASDLRCARVPGYLQKLTGSHTEKKKNPITGHVLIHAFPVGTKNAKDPGTLAQIDLDNDLTCENSVPGSIVAPWHRPWHGRSFGGGYA